MPANPAGKAGFSGPRRRANPIVPLAAGRALQPMIWHFGWMADGRSARTRRRPGGEQFLLTAFSFAALTYAFVTSDFSLRLVVRTPIRSSR
jgi:cytochrome c biogenesis factor